MKSSSNDVSIRPAKAGDGAAIFALIYELAEYEKLTDQVIGSAEQLEIDLFGAEPKCEALVAEADGQVVSYALFFGTYSTFRTQNGIYLEDLYVALDYRGQGIGRRMLAEVAKMTVSRGGGRLEWSVLDWNEPAIRFYESLGAFAQSEWTMHRLTSDALTNLAQHAK